MRQQLEEAEDELQMAEDARLRLEVMHTYTHTQCYKTEGERKGGVNTALV